MSGISSEIVLFDFSVSLWNLLGALVVPPLLLYISAWLGHARWFDKVCTGLALLFLFLLILTRLSLDAMYGIGILEGMLGAVSLFAGAVIGWAKGWNRA